MCGGRRPSRSTIVMPKTDSYDRQFERMKASMDAQMRNNSMLMQQQLQSSLRRKANLMDKITQIQMQRANNPVSIEQEVDRRVQTILSAVEGLTSKSNETVITKDEEGNEVETKVPENRPAPNIQIGDVAREKGASRMSDVDRDRGGAKKSGKAGLRIRRTKPATGKGVGLSISSGD